MTTNSPAGASLTSASTITSKEFDVMGISPPQGDMPKPAGLALPSNVRDEAAEQIAKLAGRLNASVVSEEEEATLLAERDDLLDKELVGSITKREAVRLEYVRWSLDRIDDAKYGASLDKLESRIEDINLLSKGLGNLLQKLDKASNRPPRRR